MQRADWKRLNICAKRHIPLHKEPPESGREGNGNQRKGFQELRRESYLSRGRTGFGGVGGEGERGRNKAEVGASAQPVPKAALLTRAVESGHRGPGEDGNRMARALRLPGCGGGGEARKRHARRNPQSEQYCANL